MNQEGVFAMQWWSIPYMMEMGRYTRVYKTAHVVQ